MTLFEDWGVPIVLNAAGPVTRYGGSCLSPRVLAAMAEASGSYVRLDELQLAAGRKLAEWTGAEAGYVTTGAASGLTLGASAILAGFDVDRMERLPDTEGFPNEFLLQSCHRSDYDHALRASGARLKPVEFKAAAGFESLSEVMDQHRCDRTCGTVYVFRTSDRGVPLEVWVKASHRLGLPVLVDASVRLPPVENLKRIPASGADLVAWSGGKAIQGPQHTGFLVGRSDLIASVLLQNQDMDVNAETWFLRDWLNRFPLSRPPGNGIGRGFKVSKESIVGLLVALEEYLSRDHGADLEGWHSRIDAIVEGLKPNPLCRVEKQFDPNGAYPVPVGILRLEPACRLSLAQFVNACATLPRPLLFEEGTLHQGFLVIHPMCLRKGEPEKIVDAVDFVLDILK